MVYAGLLGYLQPRAQEAFSQEKTVHFCPQRELWLIQKVHLIILNMLGKKLYFPNHLILMINSKLSSTDILRSQNAPNIITS